MFASETERSQRTDLRHRYFFHLHLEILPFIHDDASDTFLRDVKRLGSVRMAHFVFLQAVSVFEGLEMCRRLRKTGEVCFEVNKSFLSPSCKDGVLNILGLEAWGHCSLYMHHGARG